MDVNKIREDFPLLKNRDIIYLDNAATSQKPACVLDAEKRFYEKYNANPFRGLYELSEEATEYICKYLLENEEEDEIGRAHV